MIAFSIIGILVFILIYFVIRSQTLQREMTQSRQTAKVSNKRLKDAYSSLVMVCTDLQNVYVDRVESAYKKRLISAEDYAVQSFIMKHFAQIVLDCFEKHRTVEEALKTAVKAAPEITEQGVRDVMKKQPSHIRMAWIKNTPDGFMQACAQITKQPLQAQTESENTASQSYDPS